MKMFNVINPSDDSNVFGAPISENNVYIAAYAVPLAGQKHPRDLEKYEDTMVQYSLSGSKGTYRVVRIADRVTNLPKIGARVTVRIPESRHDTYANGAVECLNGKTGKVEGTKGGSEPQALVKFDTPASTWWDQQSPPSSWWFCPDELEALNEADTLRALRAAHGLDPNTGEPK